MRGVWHTGKAHRSPAIGGVFRGGVAGLSGQVNSLQLQGGFFACRGGCFLRLRVSCDLVLWKGRCWSQPGNCQPNSADHRPPPAIVKWKRPGALPQARPSHMTLDDEPLTAPATLTTPYTQCPSFVRITPLSVILSEVKNLGIFSH